ncbi:hypothetical protein [Asanoa iriomotensis]|uniref:Small secreted hydrophilic protein n=1 Tax=Asanoa iriomotensis TaxID=234613 RepID=A0ABQ4CDZ9_9ACTN|nr:hypothetical protein [Asanoa iriomotensis]GIF60975.1 hypothetical protein Air01nite_70700 [Asanoa iriomotensis]
MSAQKVATGLGAVAFAGLLVGVGAPALLGPDPVPAIQIVVPAGQVTQDGGDNEADPAGTTGAGRAPSGGDDDVEDDAVTGRSPDDDGRADDDAEEGDD